MRRIPIPRPASAFADGFVFLLVAAFIFGLTAFARRWESSYSPNYAIDLSLSALPIYAAFSALRGLIAYVLSLIFTLIVGYWAAKSVKAERIILPILDIMQSIPVLGFLPGLVLGLVAIFPNNNVGLELASIVMIFTGQVWNMTFAFYSSIKSVPNDLKESAAVMKLSSIERLRFLELPYSAMNLTWNSVMSMAGGWFFLTVCEAFVLGEKTYHLPGLGAYMAVAINTGQTQAIVAGILAMALVILAFDFFLWRPALVWAHRFRLENNPEQKMAEPLIKTLIKGSFVVRVFRSLTRRKKYSQIKIPPFFERLLRLMWQIEEKLKALTSARYVSYILMAVISAGALFGFWRLLMVLSEVSLSVWFEIMRDTLFTFFRVVGALLIGTLWATPVAIWVAQSSQRLKWAQPVIQLLASFPAPMLYPLAIAVFLILQINFEFSAMLLMLLGVQWYILFNVLAGALNIPNELRLSMQLMKSTTWQQWRYLYFPSILPALVTGWVTAAGGAWNASIVSELISYKGQTLRASGLGAQISEAAEKGDFAKLAACLSIMVVFVVFLNRTVWGRAYKIAQSRFRMDL